jgi:hypothetical protein
MVRSRHGGIRIILVRFTTWAAVAACASLVAGALSAHPDARRPSKVERFAKGGWKLIVRHDSFADQMHCRLYTKDHAILFQPAAVGFRFGSRRDTLDAWFRIDGGAPVRWQDRYPALVATGAQIDGPGIDNPMGGIVWLPIDDVRAAHMVTIRASGNGKGHRFRMRGFAAMLDAAQRLGCVSDTSFQG